MRRVCCFCQIWRSGGIESLLYNVLLRTDLTQIQVDIVVECLETSIFTEPLLELGVKFFELSSDTHKFRENCQRFRLLLQERQYDVLHLNIFQGMSLYYVHIARKEGIPIRIVHSHNTDLRQSKTRGLKLCIHQVFREIYAKDATEFWACSKDAARFMFPNQLLDKKGFSFIPNGIDFQRFHIDFAQREKTRQQHGWTNHFIIGNIGRLCYQKNQAFLLDVLREILVVNPESRLLLVGEGEDKEMLQRKAAAIGVLDKTIFYGVSKQVEQLLWAMDVLAFPSFFEGFGIAVLEAQAAGIPIVCSEFVPQEVHISPLLQPVPLSAGAAQWAKSLLEISSKNGRSDVILKNSSIFDISKVSKQIEDAYLHTSR